jgi:FlaG/FlaF family flagellin (archaellin)
MKIQKKTKNKKSKKALSIMVGYALLVVFSIVLAGITYSILKSYVPVETPTCPEGVSLLIESYDFDCGANTLTLNIVNDGRFDIGAYYIYAKDNPNLEIENIDLSSKFTSDEGAIIEPLVLFHGSGEGKNALTPGSRDTETYGLAEIGQIYSLKIVPIRFETEKRKTVETHCTDAIVRKTITCT